jgi:uncharacterized protein (DUF2141 family)
MRILGWQVGLAVGLAVVAVGDAGAQGAGRMGVHVSGLRNANGVVRCGLFTDAGSFGRPGREARGAVARINAGQATCVFSGLPAGRYAVAVFHAEQNETRMQLGAFGRPTQGYGFSGGGSTPNFSSAAFDYQGGNQSVPVRLNY